jgi:hypothetical protein
MGVAGSMDRATNQQSRAQKVQKQEHIEEINRKRGHSTVATTQARDNLNQTLQVQFFNGHALQHATGAEESMNLNDIQQNEISA